MSTKLNKIVVLVYAYVRKARKIFYFFIVGIVIFTVHNVSAQETQLDVTKQQTLGSFPGSPKETLQKYGLSSDVWVTQIYQGIIAGDDVGVSRYGGKTDAFFKIEHITYNCELAYKYELINTSSISYQELCLTWDFTSSLHCVIDTRYCYQLNLMEKTQCLL